jgi:hypothetical protein
MANTLKFGNGQWATKVGSTLAYNDEGGNFKPLPFNFTRSTGGTRVNKDGLIEMVTNNKPRIDFLNDSNGALLLEPQRSNLITYSEDYSQSEWTNATYTKDASITYNSASVAPDGTLGVYQYECTVSGTNSQLGALKAISSGVAYSNSVYLRRITGTGIVKLRGVNNGEIDVTSELTSSWKRFEITQTSNSTNGRFYINALVSGDVIEVWGAQLEAGSYATSIINTSGSAVTRAAETCSQTPPSGIIGQTEGTLFVEYSALSNDLTYRSIGLNSGAATNRLLITFNNVSNNINFLVQVGGVTQVSINYSGATITSNLKVAFAYKENDFVAYVNGTQAGTDTSGSTYSSGTLTTFSFDNSVGADKLVAKLNQVLLFPTRLSNAELQALTTI